MSPPLIYSFFSLSCISSLLISFRHWGKDSNSAGISRLLTKVTTCHTQQYEYYYYYYYYYYQYNSTGLIISAYTGTAIIINYNYTEIIIINSTGRIPIMAA